VMIPEAADRDCSSLRQRGRERICNVIVTAGTKQIKTKRPKTKVNGTGMDHDPYAAWSTVDMAKPIGQLRPLGCRLGWARREVKHRGPASAHQDVRYRETPPRLSLPVG
jgi:hypothetical protein